MVKRSKALQLKSYIVDEVQTKPWIDAGSDLAWVYVFFLGCIHKT